MQMLMQKRLGDDLNHYNQDYIEKMFISIVTELAEIIEETPWKPWKSSAKLNQDKMQEEIIDLWHFVINMTIASGLSPEKLYEIFYKKNCINHKRQENGY